MHLLHRVHLLAACFQSLALQLNEGLAVVVTAAAAAAAAGAAAPHRAKYRC